MATRSGEFGVPGGAEEDDERGNLHPDEEADDGGETSVNEAIGDFADVETEDDVGEPPEEGGDGGAGEDVGEALLIGAGDPVDKGKGGHGEEHGGEGEEDEPDAVDGEALTQEVDEPAAKGAAKNAEDPCGEDGEHGDEKEGEAAKLTMPEAETFFVVIDAMDAVHEKLHDLRAADEGAEPAEEGEGPERGAAAGEEVGNDALAAGRKETGEVADGVEEGGFAADPGRGEADGEEKRGEEGEEEVEGDGLAEDGAATEGEREHMPNAEQQGGAGGHGGIIAREGKRGVRKRIPMRLKLEGKRPIKSAGTVVPREEAT